MKIITWNLLHSTGATLDHVTTLITTHKPDLLLMQESTKIIDALPTRLGGSYSRTTQPGRQHGLAAWSPTKFTTPPTHITIQRGLIVRRIAQIITTTHITIANVHLSHGQLLNRIQLRQIAAKLPPTAAIIGDCNMVGRPLLPGFTDAGPKQPTHNAVNRIPLRLDRVLTRNLTCTNTQTLPTGPSDHHPITVTLVASTVVGNGQVNK